MKIIVIISFLLASINCFACRCNAVSQAEDFADLVVLGKVTQKNFAENGILVYAFNVSSFIKGSSKNETITLRSEAYSSSCGFGMEVGKNYKIYANLSDSLALLKKKASHNFDSFWVNACGGSFKLDQRE